jgi:hypothetical protein
MGQLTMDGDVDLDYLGLKYLPLIQQEVEWYFFFRV